MPMVHEEPTTLIEDKTPARTWVADVIVMPKEGVNDPQGEAIRNGLGMLGYDRVERVWSGRFLQVTLRAADAETARAEVAAMCEQLLANLVIEAYQISLNEIVTADETAAMEER